MKKILGIIVIFVFTTIFLTLQNVRAAESEAIPDKPDDVTPPLSKSMSGKILFIKDDNIWMMDSNGENQARVSMEKKAPKCLRFTREFGDSILLGFPNGNVVTTFGQGLCTTATGMEGGEYCCKFERHPLFLFGPGEKTAVDTGSKVLWENSQSQLAFGIVNNKYQFGANGELDEKNTLPIYSGKCGDIGDFSLSSDLKNAVFTRVEVTSGTEPCEALENVYLYNVEKKQEKKLTKFMVRLKNGIPANDRCYIGLTTFIGNDKVAFYARRFGPIKETAIFYLSTSGKRLKKIVLDEKKEWPLLILRDGERIIMRNHIKKRVEIRNLKTGQVVPLEFSGQSLYEIP